MNFYHNPKQVEDPHYFYFLHHLKFWTIVSREGLFLTDESSLLFSEIFISVYDSELCYQLAYTMHTHTHTNVSQQCVKAKINPQNFSWGLRLKESDVNNSRIFCSAIVGMVFHRGYC